MLLPAIILITLALVFYTIGVWSERVQKVLKPRNAIVFGLGLAADASGTFLMDMIAVENRAAGIGQSPLNQLMGVTGVIWLVPYIVGALGSSLG